MCADDRHTNGGVAELLSLIQQVDSDIAQIKDGLARTLEMQQVICHRVKILTVIAFATFVLVGAGFLMGRGF